MPVPNDPIRALALLWRACSDLDGAAVFTLEDERQADLMQIRKLGSVEKRRAKPHQRSLPFTSDDQWVVYFVASPEGRWLWSHIVALVDDALERGPDVIPGWTVPFI